MCFFLDFDADAPTNIARHCCLHRSSGLLWYHSFKTTPASSSCPSNTPPFLPPPYFILLSVVAYVSHIRKKMRSTSLSSRIKQKSFFYASPRHGPDRSQMRPMRHDVFIFDFVCKRTMDMHRIPAERTALAFGEGHGSSPSYYWTKRSTCNVGKSASRFFFTCPRQQFCNFTLGSIFKFLAF